MPISTNINSAVALYALMTTTDTIDLGQTYIQTADIDMTTFASPSESIAHAVGSTFYAFSGIYDGGGYTIKIGNVVSEYTGLFDTLAKPAGEGGIVKNVNLIYQNSISNTLTTDIWGGLVGEMAVCSIQNCSVTINASLNIVLNTIDSYIGAICGFMGQNSSITNTRLIINSTVELEGRNGSSVGLICGLNENSSITNCSVTTASSVFDISLKTGQSSDSIAGLICGGVVDNFTALDIPVLENITINLNNNGSIIIDNISAPDPPTPLGAFCGTMSGDATAGPDILNCSININNNQVLEGQFNDFFGQISDTEVVGCQFNYTTTTNNTSRPLTISPTPSVASVIYTNSYTNIYSLASGGTYYIPNTTGSLILGTVPITLESQSPQGILINGILQAVGTTFTSQTNQYDYTILIKGIGSMYFGFNYTGLPNIIDTPIECICQVNSCSTNSQTGISSDSRITNMREDKTIRVNVDREFMRNSVIAPKFNSYRDYMKYLQAGLKYL
jgi:hypothetical protein